MKRNKKKNFNFVEENTFKFKNPQNPKNTINFIANLTWIKNFSTKIRNLKKTNLKNKIYPKEKRNKNKNKKFENAEKFYGSRNITSFARSWPICIHYFRSSLSSIDKKESSQTFISLTKRWKRVKQTASAPTSSCYDGDLDLGRSPNQLSLKRPQYTMWQRRWGRRWRRKVCRNRSKNV